MNIIGLEYGEVVLSQDTWSVHIFYVTLDRTSPSALTLNSR